MLMITCCCSNGSDSPHRRRIRQVALLCTAPYTYKRLVTLFEFIGAI